MGNRSSTLLLALVVLAVARPAEAQVDTESRVVVEALKVASTTKDLDEMDIAFTTGLVNDARSKAIAIVKEAAALNEHEAFDRTNNYIFVTWVAKDLTGALVVRRLLLEPPAGRPFALDLPGIASADDEPKLFEVFVEGDERATFASQYRSTREVDPLLAQIPGFIQSLTGPLFGLLAGVAREMGDDVRSAAVATPLWVSASQVRLPFRRASIKVKSVAAVPTTPSEMQARLADWQLAMQLDGHLDNRFAKPYAGLVAAELPKTATAECVAQKTAAECLAALDKALTETLASCKTTCVSGTTPTADDDKALAAALGRFRGFLKTLSQTVTGEAAFVNRPPTRFSFGAMSGVITYGEVNKPRAKLDNAGKVVADPLGRLLTMAVINWTPWGYDADAFTPSGREYFRFFGGAMLTPDFGVGGGVSFLIVRGAAINIGGGWLYCKAVPSDAAFGAPPADAKKPFEPGTAKVVFFGMSFNTK